VSPLAISPSVGDLDSAWPKFAAPGLRNFARVQGRLQPLGEQGNYLSAALALLGHRAEIRQPDLHGPLAVDGARWFGVGHWFAATGYDQNGIYIRDSSRWDIRYLTWSRLYGEVGYSG
jgi:hypothetical protein